MKTTNSAFRVVQRHRGKVLTIAFLTACVSLVSEGVASAQIATSLDFFDNLRSFSTRNVFEHDTSQVPNSGGYGFKMLYAAGTWTQGPPSEPTYVDDTWAMGLNIGANAGLKADPNKQYAALHWESKFYQGPGDPASPLTEVFLHVVDVNGAAHRPLAWTGRHDGSYADLVLASSTIAFQNYQHRPKLALKLGAGDVGGQVEVYDGLKFVYYKNNTPVAYQTAANGASSVALPYVDDADAIVMSRPVTGINGGSLTAVSRGSNSTVFQGSSPEAAAANVMFSTGTGSATKTGSIGIDRGGNFVVRQASSGGAMFVDYNTSVYLRDKSSGAYSTKMVVSNGKVGVGNAAPTHTLDVSGRARVGTPDKPTGITLYDTATKAPYCLQITNGAPVSVPGECK